MKIGSLFSGIGGLELGLERGLCAAGLAPEVVYQVERSAFCRHLLARHWPHAQRFDDVCSVGAAVLPSVDLLCGGFPCQDVSSAGKRAGLDGARSGLWWEFARIIEETRPAWIVVENVASGARRWLPAVRRALGARGYASLPLGIAACEVGARHRRERVFVVAADAVRYPGSEWVGARGILGASTSAEPSPAHPDRQGQLQPSGLLEQVGRWADHGAAADLDGLRGVARRRQSRQPSQVRADAARGAAADLDRQGLPHGQRERGDLGEAPNAAPERDPGALSPGFGLPPRPWMVRGVHGLPGGVDGPWRAAGWTPARLREARIRALGNSVVPAQVEPIGRLIGMLVQAQRRAA